MRSLFLIILGVLIGGAGSLYLDRSPEWRPQIDTLIAPIWSKVFPSELAEYGLTEADMASLSMVPCFERDPAFGESPPSWLSRNELGPMSAQRLPQREYPDLEAMPGLVKLEQILSAGGSQRHHCAATRISKHWFLTANHCVLMRGTSAVIVDMMIIAPQNDVMQANAKIVPVSAGICHSAWFNSTGKFDDDIALIYAEDVTGLEAVQIAKLDTAAAPLPPADYENAYFAGWGKNGDNRFLQGGPVNVSNLGEAFILGNNNGAFGPCVGDSGGPLYVGRDGAPRVVGVLSSVTTDACPPYGLAFFMRVKSFQDWIQRAMTTCIKEGVFICRREAIGI